MLYGGKNPSNDRGKLVLSPFRYPVRSNSGKKVALVLGYPAFDGPIVEFVLEKAGYGVEVFDRELLPSSKFGDYAGVVFMGSTTRAKMEPSGYAEGDFALVKAYLDGGGKVVLGRELHRQLFPGEDGRRFWERIVGRKVNGKGLVRMDVPVGKGRLVYCGEEVAKYLPSGRKPSTVAMGELYLAKYGEMEELLLGLMK